MLGLTVVLLQVLSIAAGLAALGASLHHVLRSVQFTRRGVHQVGVVVRLETTGVAEGGARIQAPVIAFVDERGVRREFTSNISSARPKLAAGESVPVAHLPGRPETARMHTTRHTVHVLAITSVAAVVFLGAGLYSVLSG